MNPLPNNPFNVQYHERVQRAVDRYDELEAVWDSLIKVLSTSPEAPLPTGFGVVRVESHTGDGHETPAVYTCKNVRGEWWPESMLQGIEPLRLFAGEIAYNPAPDGKHGFVWFNGYDSQGALNPPNFWVHEVYDTTQCPTRQQALAAVAAGWPDNVMKENGYDAEETLNYLISRA